MKTAGLLLAAGASERFGSQDKLLADLGGRPMVSYAAEALRGIDLACKIAVISNEALRRELPDFDCVTRIGFVTSQSASLQTGMQEVLSHDVDRVLIVLGDMPFVTPLSLQRLLEAYCVDRGSGSINGAQRCPPACFPRGSFHELMAQSGDQGARALLHKLPSEALVTLSDREALDIDTQDQIGLYADIAQTDLGRVGTDAQFIKKP